MAQDFILEGQPISVLEIVSRNCVRLFNHTPVILSSARNAGGKV